MTDDSRSNNPEPAKTPTLPVSIQTEQRLLELTESAIDERVLTEFVRDPLCGAVVLFLGTVRELTAGRRTLSLKYEAYPSMALTELQRLSETIQQEFPIQKIAIAHRLGPLELGDIAIGLAVSSPHRQAAFEAGQQLMNRIKETVPIWKKEYWADGSSEWIHPDQ